MSKISSTVKAEAKNQRVNEELHTSEIVTNFMGGDSYKVDPITTLKMVTSSSIFGEPSYYKGSSLGNRKPLFTFGLFGRSHEIDKLIDEYKVLFDLDKTTGTDTVATMEKVIDNALSYDFKATLDWAVTLRNDYYIRLNPQVIMVRAALHEGRHKFTEANPGEFKRINSLVMFRADDCLAQMAYYLYKNENKKNNIPSLLKRSWAEKLGGLNTYQMAKYKNAEIGMINGVRICHAKSSVIDELMRTGTLELTQEEETWERMRSAGKSWEEIFKTVKMGHMALLRNMRNFLSEVSDYSLAEEYMNAVMAGVKSGKQFPFRYYSAYKAIKDCHTDLNHKQLALDTLERCMDISVENMPKLKGRTMCLSDNSGSAWGGLTTEYGSVVVAEIDNLSSVITAMRSDEGYVGKFGDKLKIFPISKRRGVLEQAIEISKSRCDDVGGGTEGGIWEFWNNAMQNNEHWDNVFIYSDQQAGTGGLYGTDAQLNQYKKQGYCVDGIRINVFKMVIDYRKKVFSKVNVFSVQTAGYDNTVLPTYAYRTNLLYGWTGKEAVFADRMNKIWDEYESAHSQS